MNKATFRWAFLALLASSLTGCASPLRLFEKQPKSFEEFRAERMATQNQVASNPADTGGQGEIAELLHKGHAAFQQGNLPEAQSYYWAIVQRQPSHPVANHRLGVIADRQQDYLSAQRHYFAALQASPRDANLLNDIGYSFLLQSRYVEAEQYLQAALRLNSTQSNALNNLGLLYAKQGQAERALAMFRRTTSEAEAQAKLAKLMPSGLGAATPGATMLAQNNVASPNPWNAGPASSVPNTPSLASGGASNLAPGTWSSLDAVPNGGGSPIAQVGASVPAANIDPNHPDATRLLKEQMERERQRAIAERQGRDYAERQRRELIVARQRDEELARSRTTNPNPVQPSESSRWNLPPGNQPNTAGLANAPIVVGPTSLNGTATPHSANGWNNHTLGAAVPNANVELIPAGMPNAPANLIPGAGSPLDTMPSWPPPEAGTVPAPIPSAPAAAQWPTVNPAGAEDPARAASRLGMNAGPGNLFQIAPGPASAPTIPLSRPANAGPGQLAPPNAGVPVAPPNWQPNWPANSNHPNEAWPAGEPPAGSFGPGNFHSSANSQSPWSDSPAQQALRDQVPPSEQYHTPNQFGAGASAAAAPGAISRIGTNSNAGGIPVSPFRSASFPAPISNSMPTGRPLDRGASRAATADSFGSNPWEQGTPAGVPGRQSSATTTEGFLPAAAGDASLQEYERMIQLHNAETNSIRQQLDAQRQLPGSENFSRGYSQPQNAAARQPGVRPQ